MAILADGGGHATIAADLLSELGLVIPPLKEATRKKLQKLLPFNASVGNPIDVAGGTDANPALFADCAEVLLSDREVDGLLIVGLFGGYGIRFDKSLSFFEEDAAHRMGKLVREKQKPIIVHSLYSALKTHPLDLLRYYGIPVNDSLDVACKCIGVLSEYGAYLDRYHSKARFSISPGKNRRKKATAIFKEAARDGRKALFEHEAKAVLAAYGLPHTSEGLAASAEEAVRLAAGIDGPVAMKIVSPEILHKSDVGGVRLNLQGEAEITKAFGEIMTSAKTAVPKADVRGVLVTPMVAKGMEIIIGTMMDDQFGPVIMFGLGGIHVEVMKDVVFRVLPISRHWAMKMLDDIRAAPLLNGYRGQPPCDKKAMVDLLLAVSDVIESYPEIAEMDLNPVMVYEQGLSIADARVILKTV